MKEKHSVSPRGITVGVLKRMGERLSSDERAPYERPPYDESFDLAAPTNPKVAALRTDESDAQ